MEETRPTRYIDYPTSKKVLAWYDNPTERVYVKRVMARALTQQDEFYRMNVEACPKGGD